MTTCEFNIGASDVISILAMLVSGFAALYARWAWVQAVRANEISLFGYRKEVYDAFFELKMHMQQKAEFAELIEVSKFYYPSRNAHLYLPKELAEWISLYYEACFWVADIHRSNGGVVDGSVEQCRPHLAEEKRLAPQIEASLTGLIRKVN